MPFVATFKFSFESTVEPIWLDVDDDDVVVLCWLRFEYETVEINLEFKWSFSGGGTAFDSFVANVVDLALTLIICNGSFIGLSFFCGCWLFDVDDDVDVDVDVDNNKE